MKIAEPREAAKFVELMRINRIESDDAVMKMIQVTIDDLSLISQTLINLPRRKPPRFNETTCWKASLRLTIYLLKITSMPCNCFAEDLAPGSNLLVLIMDFITGKLQRIPQAIRFGRS